MVEIILNFWEALKLCCSFAGMIMPSPKDKLFIFPLIVISAAPSMI